MSLPKIFMVLVMCVPCLWCEEIDWGRYFDDWIEIPREVLDEIEKRNKESMPGADIAHWAKGFQKKSAMWKMPPYILLQYHKSNNPDVEVKAMHAEAEKVQREMPKELERQSNGTLIVDGTWLPVYDDLSKATILKNRINGPNGPMISLTIMKSSNGMIYQYSCCVVDGRPNSIREAMEIQKFVLSLK